jgi:sporulation protein YlmC with PRC-barrel domain
MENPMKSLLLSTALAAALALPAMAQDIFRAEMTEGSVAASDLLGARIYAADAAIDGDAFDGVQDNWSDIGEVNDVILSRDGQVESVLVDIGGFLGMGERQVAVDMAALRFVQDSATDADDWFLVMQADRPTLEGAPEWSMEPANTADATDATATDPAVEETAVVEGEAVDGATTTETEATADATAVEPAAEDPAVAEGDAAMTNETETTADTAAVDGTATTETETTADATAVDPAATTETTADATAVDPAATTETEVAADTAPAREPTVREGYGPVESAALTSEMLTGADVYDDTDASIGEVSDLILTEDGQITHVVVDVGGFLGIGERRVALDLSQIDILTAEGGTDVRVYVPMAKEELEALPAIEG